LCDTLLLSETPLPDPAQVSSVRRFGSFEINLQSGELRKNGMRLRLAGQPFQVLALLVERPGEVVTREELNSKLWPADTFVDFDHGLNNAVARIREVLDDSADTPRYVETIPRRGYRFIAPLADLRPALVPSPAAEARVSPAHEITRPSASGPSGLPTERRFASSYPKVLLGGIAALVLALSTVALVLNRSGAANGTRQAPIKVLAVLPLKNLSGDATQDYLADGITEALIGRLSGIHDLRVISRTSVMRFKDAQLSVPEIASTLRVDAIVEGSVIREGSRIRVSAQLIRGATDEHLWSETYDRELRDVLDLESQVAQSIARRVEVTVTGKERARLVAARSVSPDVYESYLKGRFGKSIRRADIEVSIAHFEEAIRKDATFAPAYVGLAEAYQNLGRILVGAPPDEVRPKVIGAAQKALELDPEIARAHAVLADVYLARWQWTDAEAEYDRALELNPNDAAAHLGLAQWLLCQGRMEEALAWARRGRELDPVGVSGARIAWILFQARRYDEATHELRSVLAVRPDDADALWILGFALIAKGRSEEAIPVLEKTVSLMDRSPGSIELLATAYAHAARRMEALRLIDELKGRRQTSYVPAGALINPYLALGDYDQAFAWFERAYQEQSNILRFLKVHPFFDPVRADPRFADLLRRVGLDQSR
jgi:TolB-like protein/DNA-binding winged helix-turn-helix (wHTH) protein/thioredoxin-like negative regulator of GroEL